MRKVLLGALLLLAAAPCSAESLWVTIALAPARVVAYGRFAAARPSYHGRH